MDTDSIRPQKSSPLDITPGGNRFPDMLSCRRSPMVRARMEIDDTMHT